ncbi:interleukin 17-like protein [Glandiceps talaboti]
MYHIVFVYLCGILITANLRLAASAVLQNVPVNNLETQELSDGSDQQDDVPNETPISNRRFLNTDVNDASDDSKNLVSSCLEPPPRDLHKRLKKKETLYPQGPMFAIFPVEDSESSKNSIQQADNLYSFTTPNFTCPLDLTNLAHDMSDRAICPWTLTIDNDPNRFPKVMAVASCRCRGCIDTSGPRESLDNYCQPVTYGVRVLKRQPECENGYYQYKFDWVKVPVACVCLRPRLSRLPQQLG